MNHQKYQHTNHRNTFTDKEVEAHWDSVARIYVAENDKVKATHDQRFHESMIHLKLTGAGRVLNISSRDAEANDFIHRYKSDVEVVNAEISAGLMAEARKRRPEAVQQKIETYSQTTAISIGYSASKPWNIAPIHWPFCMNYIALAQTRHDWYSAVRQPPAKSLTVFIQLFLAVMAKGHTVFRPRQR